MTRSPCRILLSTAFTVLLAGGCASGARSSSGHGNEVTDAGSTAACPGEAAALERVRRGRTEGRLEFPRRILTQALEQCPDRLGSLGPPLLEVLVAQGRFDEAGALATRLGSPLTRPTQSDDRAGLRRAFVSALEAGDEARLRTAADRYLAALLREPGTSVKLAEAPNGGVRASSRRWLDTRHFVAPSEMGVAVFEVEALDKARALPRAARPVELLVAVPDGRSVVGLGPLGYVLWDASAGRLVAQGDQVVPFQDETAVHPGVALGLVTTEVTKDLTPPAAWRVDPETRLQYRVASLEVVDLRTGATRCRWEPDQRPVLPSRAADAAETMLRKQTFFQGLIDGSHTIGIRKSRLTSDGALVLAEVQFPGSVGEFEHEVVLIDASTCRHVTRYPGGNATIDGGTIYAWDPRRRGPVQRFDLTTRRPLRPWNLGGCATSGDFRFGTDGRTMVTTYALPPAFEPAWGCLVDVATGRVVLHVPGLTFHSGACAHTREYCEDDPMPMEPVASVVPGALWATFEAARYAQLFGPGGRKLLRADRRLGPLAGNRELVIGASRTEEQGPTYELLDARGKRTSLPALTKELRRLLEDSPRLLRGGSRLLVADSDGQAATLIDTERWVVLGTLGSMNPLGESLSLAPDEDHLLFEDRTGHARLANLVTGSVQDVPRSPGPLQRCIIGEHSYPSVLCEDHLLPVNGR